LRIARIGGSRMPIQKIEKKTAQKGKRKKKGKQNEFLFIRIIRLLFFASVIGFAVYLYILFEKGKLLFFLSNAMIHSWGVLKKGFDLALLFAGQHPGLIFFLIINNLLFAFIGYWIAKKRGG
jgi:hypothetical protein